MVISVAIYVLIESTWVPLLFLSAFIASTSFSVYFHLSVRINGLSIPVSLFAIAMGIAFVAGVVLESLLIVSVCEAAYLSMAIIYRKKAKQGFAGIDWSRVRPYLNHANGTPNSIWVR